MAIDNRTYGFNREDAESLLGEIVNRETEIPEVAHIPFLGATIEFTVMTLEDITSGPYTGLRGGFVRVRGASPQASGLIGTQVYVIDHSMQIFDNNELIGYTGWAQQMVFVSKASGAACDDMTDVHWVAVNRTCEANDDTYAALCE